MIDNNHDEDELYIISLSYGKLFEIFLQHFYEIYSVSGLILTVIFRTKTKRIFKPEINYWEKKKNSIQVIKKIQ